MSDTHKGNTVKVIGDAVVIGVCEEFSAEKVPVPAEHHFCDICEEKDELIAEMLEALKDLYEEAYELKTTGDISMTSLNKAFYAIAKAEGGE